MRNKEAHSQIHVVIIFCVPLNYMPSKSTDKSTWGKNTYIKHIIIKPIEISTLQRLQMFLLTKKNHISSKLVCIKILKNIATVLHLYSFVVLFSIYPNRMK
jgi:hypothetical protein